MIEIKEKCIKNMKPKFPNNNKRHTEPQRLEGSILTAYHQYRGGALEGQ